MPASTPARTPLGHPRRPDDGERLHVDPARPGRNVASDAPAHRETTATLRDVRAELALLMQRFDAT